MQYVIILPSGSTLYKVCYRQLSLRRCPQYGIIIYKHMHKLKSNKRPSVEALCILYCSKLNTIDSVFGHPNTNRMPSTIRAYISYLFEHVTPQPTVYFVVYFSTFYSAIYRWYTSSCPWTKTSSRHDIR